jgi:amino-acid N-acetyltransferase
VPFEGITILAIDGSASKLHSMRNSRKVDANAPALSAAAQEDGTPRPIMSVEVARVSDLDDIRSLLRSNGLPTEDLEASGVEAHWVCRDAGRVAGSVGMDVVGTVAVVRSLVTDPEFRGQHVATALCDAVEDHARRRGVTAAYLLTESASGFFERRGYRAVARAAVPDAVSRHRQFASGCCQCASTMMKALD